MTGFSTAFAVGEEIAIGGAMSTYLGTAGVTSSTSMSAGAFDNYWNTNTVNDPYWVDVGGFDDNIVHVRKNTTTIDNVDYDTVYFDRELSEYFRDEGIAYLTDKGYTDNQTYEVPWVVKEFDGFPLVQDGAFQVFDCGTIPLTNGATGFVGGTAYSVSYTQDASAAYITFTREGVSSMMEVYVAQTSGGSAVIRGEITGDWPPVSGGNNGLGYMYWRVPYSNWSWAAGLNININDEIVYDTSAIDIYTGTIDTSQPPVDKLLSALIPTSYLSSIGAGDYPITSGAGIDTLYQLNEAAAVDDTRQPDWRDLPVIPPTPPPIPDTSLGDVPYEDFLDTFGQSVYNKIDETTDAVDTAGQSIVGELEDTQSVIDTVGQSIVDAIEAVEDKIDSLIDSIADVLEAIMTHPLDLFSAWLDRLPEIPAIKDIFDGIKRHVGIWHYVVEWLGCIGTFLAFFIGLFGDVAYCMVVPIYACVAGAICLAFYKRFAR